MKQAARLFLMLCLAVVAHAGQAQSMLPPPADYDGQDARAPQRAWSPEQREQWREARRREREAWQQMSPEERHQLRRDIREAGRLYPRGPRWRKPRRD